MQHLPQGLRADLLPVSCGLLWCDASRICHEDVVYYRIQVMGSLLRLDLCKYYYVVDYLVLIF